MDNNFLMFGNYRKHIEVLSGEQTKELMLMMFDFADGEEPESEDILVTTMFNFMKDNAVVGSKRRIANVENGKKGGRPIKAKETKPKEVKPKEPKKEKQLYGEFKRVELDDEQYNKAVVVYNEVDIKNKTTGTLNEAIEILDIYLENNPKKKYANHYAVLNGWVKDKVKERTKPKTQTYNQTATYVEPTYAKHEPIKDFTEEEIEDILNNIY